MPKVTISGSFKRDLDGLLLVYSELASYGCEILSDMVHTVPKMKIGAYTGVVIRLNGKFLTMHFTKKKEREWRFAGGKVESGEHAFGCVVRELKEELGVEAASAKMVYRHTHAVDSGIWTGYYFLIEPVGVPRIMEPDKNDDLAYINADRLEELGSHPECEVARLLEEQDKKV